MPLVQGLVDVCRRFPVDRPEVLPQGFLMILDRGHPIVRPAWPSQQPGRFGLGMQGMQGDDPAPQVEFPEQGPHGRDLVGAVRNSRLPRGDAGAMLEGRDQDEPAFCILPRGTADGLVVPRHRGLLALFPLPPAFSVESGGIADRK